jgi:hypothetical protein
MDVHLEKRRPSSSTMPVAKGGRPSYPRKISCEEKTQSIKKFVIIPYFS